MNSSTQILHQWVQDYTAELLQWAMRKTGNRTLAEDLVQDTFLVATEKFHTFKNESSPKTWLFAILKFKIADHFRALKHPTLSLSSDNFFDNSHWHTDYAPKDWEADEHLLDNLQFTQVWQNCIDTLPPNHRICITHRYLQNVSADEICQDLNLSSANYWQIVHRAKIKLRHCLEINWFNL